MSLENLRGYANKGMICSTRLMAEGVLAVAGRGTLDFSGKTRLNAPEGKWLLARSVVGASDMSSGQDFWQGVSPSGFFARRALGTLLCTSKRGPLTIIKEIASTAAFLPFDLHPPPPPTSLHPAPQRLRPVTMADRYIPEHRRTTFKAKNLLKPDELRRRREEQQVEIRKQKREENLAKRRNHPR